MTWQATIFWDTQDPMNVGWRWSIINFEGNRSESGVVDSVESGMHQVHACLSRFGVDPSTVTIEVIDEGVWDKC